MPSGRPYSDRRRRVAFCGQNRIVKTNFNSNRHKQQRRQFVRAVASIAAVAKRGAHGRHAQAFLSSCLSGPPPSLISIVPCVVRFSR